MTTPSETTPPDNPDRLDRLINLATALNAEVEILARDSGKQFVSLARTARTNRILVWAAITAGVVNLALVAVVSIIGLGVVDNTNRIDSLTQSIEATQTEQRRRALCPLYGVLMDNESPEGRKAAMDKLKYDHAFEVIEDGYLVLGCDKFLDESGRDQW
jgi:hypothetical protein